MERADPVCFTNQRHLEYQHIKLEHIKCMPLSVSWGILKAHILDGKLVSDEGRKFPSIVL